MKIDQCHFHQLFPKCLKNWFTTKYPFFKELHFTVNPQQFVFLNKRFTEFAGAAIYYFMIGNKGNII